MMAPFSGDVYIQHPNSGPIMWTSVLETIDVPVPIQVWLQVAETGAIRFLRQAEGKDLEDAGFLPPDCFPRWVTSYFACVHCWCHTLNAPATLSVDYAGDCFPLSLCPAEPAELDSVWKLIED